MSATCFTRAARGIGFATRRRMRAFALLTVLVGCSSIDGPEILRNPDFEQLDGTGWLADWTNMDRNPDGEIVVVKNPVASGEFAVQWQMAANADGWEYWFTQDGIDPQQLVPGHEYELDGWYFVDQPGDVALNYIVRGQPDDTPNLETVSQVPTYPKVVGKWAHFSFHFTIPGNATPQMYEVSLHSIKFNGAATKLTLDNVSLHEI